MFLLQKEPASSRTPALAMVIFDSAPHPGQSTIHLSNQPDELHEKYNINFELKKAGGGSDAVAAAPGQVPLTDFRSTSQNL